MFCCQILKINMENYYLDIFNLILNILLVIGILLVLYVKNRNHKMIIRNYTQTINALESAYNGEQKISQDWRDLFFDLKNKSKVKMPICISFCVDSVMFNNNSIVALATLLVKKGFNILLIDNGNTTEESIDELLLRIHLTAEHVVEIEKDDTFFISDHNIHIHFCSNIKCVDAINRDYPASKPGVLVAQ
jgi:predicted phosphatase